jgi:signal transduction histidine kinase
MELKRRGIRIVIGVVAWTAIGAFFALPYILRGREHSAWLAIIFNWWVWGALTPLITTLDDRLSATFTQPLRLLAAHLVAGFLVTALYVAIAATVEYEAGLNKWVPWKEPLGLLDWYLWAGVIYGMILGVIKGLKYYKRHMADELQLERLERRFLETRMNALRAQLDPHFLFNALNAISACVEHEPKLARRMIEHLGDLLRLSLETRHRQEVSLAEEIAFLEHYFALHRMRFAERIAITVSVAPEVAQARIPSMLLLPLVENAFKHGLADRAADGQVMVSAQGRDGQVEIRVMDNGAGLPQGWSMETARGLGLAVTRERLLAMFGPEAGQFSITPRAGGGTEVRISIPFSLHEENKHALAAA